jgi:hypothetical protein
MSAHKVEATARSCGVFRGAEGFRAARTVNH